VYLVPFGGQLLSHVPTEATFELDIVAAKRALCEPRRLDCRLNVHPKIGDIRNKLSVCLRLIPPKRGSKNSTIQARKRFHGIGE
jgi:hypothetical protein